MASMNDAINLVKPCIYCSSDDQRVYCPPAMHHAICPPCKASIEAKVEKFDKIAQPFAAIDSLLAWHRDECDRTQVHWEHTAKLIELSQRVVDDLNREYLWIEDRGLLEDLSKHLDLIKELNTDDGSNGTETSHARAEASIPVESGSADDSGEDEIHGSGREISEC